MRAGAQLERGAMAIPVAAVTLILGGLLVAGVTVGQVAVQRQEQQTATDALAILCAQIAKTEGVPAIDDHPAFAQLFDGNMDAETADRIERMCAFDDDSGSVDAQADGDAGGVPQMLRPGDGDEGAGWHVRTTAAAQVGQGVFGEDVELRYPKLVLVLDYSGSMGAGFGGGTRMDSLRNAVNGLIGQDLRIDYGLVMFNGDVIDTAGVARDNGAALLNKVGSRGPGGMTNYQSSLNAASNLLVATEDTGYYVLFVTDGFPSTHGEPEALAAAAAARAAGVTLFTLNVGGGVAQRNLLIDMGGGPADAGDEGYYFEAGNDAALQDSFRKITADILCRIGPLDPVPADPDDLYAYLRDPGDPSSEEPLTPLAPADIAEADDDELGFAWDAAESKLRLTEAACMQVVEEGREIVARHGRPRLTG